MSETGTCPSCGAVIPSDAPEGFCPRCLYRIGFEEGPKGQKTDIRGQKSEVRTPTADVDNQPMADGPSLAPQPSPPAPLSGDDELFEGIGRGA